MTLALLTSLLLQANPAPAPAKGLCGDALTTAFDDASAAMSKRSDAAVLDGLAKRLATPPTTCAAADYETYLRRLSDLLAVAASGGIDEGERRVLGLLRGWAPRRFEARELTTARSRHEELGKRLVEHLPEAQVAAVMAWWRHVAPEPLVEEPGCPEVPAQATAGELDGAIHELELGRPESALTLLKRIRGAVPPPALANPDAGR